ncbi:MAG TPA: hypothetical protein VKE71_00605 [Candidatus Angelobacter sp.]|nr:hypothetical protein [Candidatus Angelobacter sp.]
MTIRKTQSGLMLLLSILCAFVLVGCSIHTSKSGDDKTKDVDIRSPFGSISVHEGGTDAKDLGLPLYPGARPSKGHGNNDDNAHVNISSPFLGLKVVVQKFETDDSPSKVLDYYQKPMSKYGKVIQCSGGSGGNYHHHDKDAPVSCDNDSGDDYEKSLKVGTENNQHVVAVKPRGKGSEFVLVYVRAQVHDDKDTI